MVAEYDVDQRRLFGPSGDSYTVMALMNFNLFNGLADLARVRESRAQEAQARDLKQELEDRIRHQVTEAILNLQDGPRAPAGGPGQPWPRPGRACA